MAKHKFYKSIWHTKYISKGKTLWEFDKRNALVDEGEKLLLNTFFRATDVPTKFYVGLNYGELNEQSTLIHIANEPSGNGYARATLERDTVDFPALELDEGDYQLTTKTLTFSASGGTVGPVNVAFIATSTDNSGFLVSFISMPNTFTISDGDSVEFTIKIKAM